jgi:hypothetical protein
MLHRIKGEIQFQCDYCDHEVLETEETEFTSAVEVLRTRGWTALPPPLGKSEWRHRCPGCRFEPHRVRQPDLVRTAYKVRR